MDRANPHWEVRLKSEDLTPQANVTVRNEVVETVEHVVFFEDHTEEKTTNYSKAVIVAVDQIMSTGTRRGIYLTSKNYMLFFQNDKSDFSGRRKS